MTTNRIAIVLATATMLLCAGCAKEDNTPATYWITDAKRLAGSSSGNEFGNGVAVTLNKADTMFERWLRKNKSDNLKYRNEAISDEVGFVAWNEYIDSAYQKRVHALLMGRCLYTYTFKNYIGFDGVSGLIYNTAYVFSIPRKILTGFLTSEGAIEYLWNTTKLLVGGVFAVVGIPCSFVVNSICHPWETLANLTVGVLYFGEGWGTYVANTNIIVSLWDLVWGAILYPLFQALIFFM